MAGAGDSGSQREQAERGGKEIGEGRALGGEDAGGIVAREEDGDSGGVKGELEQGLPTGAARYGRGLVEIGDGDGGEADGRAKLGDGRGNGGLLGAGGEAEAGDLDVAAGDDGAGVGTGEEDGGTDAEAAVRGIGVSGGGAGAGLEILEEIRCERST